MKKPKDYEKKMAPVPDNLNEHGKPVEATDLYDNVSDDYVPEGFDSVEEFLQDMRENYQLDVDFDRENREQALDDKRFTAGEQWDPQVLEQRQGLPCLVINSIPQFTAQLVGDWRESRKSIKVLPVEDKDTDVASIRSDLVRSIELQSRAGRTYDSAFESVVQCGDGAFRVSVEYARDSVFDQDIFIRPIEDALSVVWDRMSVDPTGRDANRVFVDDMIPKKEFERKWPEKAPSNLGEEILSELRTEGWIDSAGVRITEYWRMLERDRLIGLFQDGSVRFIEDSNMQELIETYGRPVKTRVTPCRYAQMHLVTGFDILSGPYEYRLNRLPVVRMTGRIINIGGRRVRHGLVRAMKDPVRLKNFWRSVAAEQLGYAPKAQWIATESAVEGHEEEIRKAHFTRDPLITVNDEAIIGQNIQRLDPPVPQAALLNEANVNAQDMKDVTGIHDASLGIKSNETSGRAINARQREGDIASLTYYDNGNASVLEGGDVVNQLISQIYDGTRTIRIVGEDESVKFQRINDPMDPRSPNLAVGMFDVVLSSGTSYTTRRAEAAASMMEAVQVAPQLMEIAPDLIAKYQDWPGADKLAERLKRAVPPQFLDPSERDPNAQQPGVPPEQMQEMMQELQKLQMENQELKMDRSLEERKLEIEEYKAKTDRIEALSDHEVDNSKMALDAIAKLLDHKGKAEDREVKKSASTKKEGTE